VLVAELRVVLLAERAALLDQEEDGDVHDDERNRDDRCPYRRVAIPQGQHDRRLRVHARATVLLRTIASTIEIGDRLPEWRRTSSSGGISTLGSSSRR